MRKLLLALPLLLAGCVTPGPNPISVLPDSVQKAFVTACGIALTADSLSSVISVFSGFDVSQYTSIAAKFCGSFQPTTARSEGGRPVLIGRVGGVRVTGVRVR